MAVKPQPTHSTYIVSSPAGDDLCQITAVSEVHAAALAMPTLQSDAPNTYGLAVEWLASGWPTVDDIRPADSPMGFVITE